MAEPDKVTVTINDIAQFDPEVRVEFDEVWWSLCLTPEEALALANALIEGAARAPRKETWEKILYV